MTKKKSKGQWKGYSEYTYLEGKGKNAKPVKANALYCPAVSYLSQASTSVAVALVTLRTPG